MSDRHLITTTLKGYINALKPSGKFNNCTIGFVIPKEDLETFEATYERALAWGAAKMAGKRHTQELQKWDESGYVKISYGGPDTSHGLFPWVDTQGLPIPLDTDIREGTTVRLIVDLKPYVFGSKVGLSLKVRGAQVLKLVSGGGSDAGDLSTDDVATLFGTTEGYKANAPNFEPSEDALAAAGEVDEDDDLPF